MGKIISENASFVQVMAVTKKTSEFNSSDYLSALKDRKIGGWERLQM